jgi:hypothetical protein
VVSGYSGTGSEPLFHLSVEIAVRKACNHSRRLDAVVTVIHSSNRATIEDGFSFGQDNNFG